MGGLLSLVIIGGLISGCATTGFVLYDNPKLTVKIIEKLIIIISIMLGMRQLILLAPRIINNSYESVFSKYIYNLFVGDYHLVLGSNAQNMLLQALSDPMVSVFTIPCVGIVISVIFSKIMRMADK